MIECTQMNYALPKDATTRVHHALAAAHARALSRLRAHPRRGTAARVGDERRVVAAWLGRVTNELERATALAACVEGLGRRQVASASSA